MNKPELSQREPSDGQFKIGKLKMALKPNQDDELDDRDYLEATSEIMEEWESAADNLAYQAL